MVDVRTGSRIHGGSGEVKAKSPEFLGAASLELKDEVFHWHGE